MNLDVAFFHYLTLRCGWPMNVDTSHLQDVLADVEKSDEMRRIVDLFRESIANVYGREYSADQILGWMKGLHRMFDLAAGNILNAFRAVGVAKSFSYASYEELKANESELLDLTTVKDRSENFLKSPKISYIEEVIPHFYKVFVPTALKAYSYIFEGGDTLSAADVCPIDLDTGRPLAVNGDLNVIPTYWERT